LDVLSRNRESNRRVLRWVSRGLLHPSFVIERSSSTNSRIDSRNSEQQYSYGHGHYLYDTPPLISAILVSKKADLLCPSIGTVDDPLINDLNGAIAWLAVHLKALVLSGSTKLFRYTNLPFNTVYDRFAFHPDQNRVVLLPPMEYVAFDDEDAFIERPVPTPVFPVVTLEAWRNHPSTLTMSLAKIPQSGLLHVDSFGELGLGRILGRMDWIRALLRDT
jgi:hypothetical protein